MSEAVDLPRTYARPTILSPAAGLRLAFAVTAALLLWFWWSATGGQPIRGLADLLNAAGRLTGLVGTYLVLWQLLLIARVPWVEAGLGMERNLRLHRLNAYLSLGLITAHAVLQTVAYMLGDGLGVLGQLVDFIQHYDGALMAIVALVLMLGVVAASIGVPRRRLSYETWYFIHLYVYLAIALAFLHEVALGADFLHNPLFVAYWVALYAVVAACLLGYRVAAPLLRWRRHRFHVEETVREAARVTSVYVGGRDLGRFQFRAGQFLIWRFLDRERWSQAHPFSLSAPANDEYLRLTVRGIGDFSRQLAQLAPGTPVLVEGPFGRFTADQAASQRVLLLAGGIGITPIRALAEEMAGDGFDVVLLYRARRAQDVAFREELDELATELGVRVEILVPPAADARRRGPAPNWLRPAELRRLVPDVGDRDVFVCGPPGMIESARQALTELGVGSDRIHVEVFRF